MNQFLKCLFSGAILLIPMLVMSQVQPTTKDTTRKDSLSKPPDSLAMAKVDTVRVIVDTVVKKDCYTEYYDIMRSRGAKAVTDGMQPVVIALKTEASCHCFMGQVEVVNGKIKPPLFFQSESGEYRPVSVAGKKLEPAFVASMSSDELYGIKDGMSVVFRTADQEYGRLFFYTFVNKSGNSNKSAPSPTDLIKE